MIGVLHILSRAFGGLALAMLLPAAIAVVVARTARRQTSCWSPA